jgi:hypothetical protein
MMIQDPASASIWWVGNAIKLCMLSYLGRIDLSYRCVLLAPGYRLKKVLPTGNV